MEDPENVTRLEGGSLQEEFPYVSLCGGLTKAVRAST
jgi:hypothetical protein